MRKIIGVAAGCLALSTICLAEETSDSQPAVVAQQGAWTYLGASAFVGDVKYEGSVDGVTAHSKKYKAKGLVLSIGTVDSAGLGIEGYFKYEDNDGWENGITGFGGSLRKAFGEPTQGRPFLKVGLEIGATDLEDVPGVITTEDSIAYYGVVFGAGFEKRINKDLEIFGGVDIGSRQWQDIELIYPTGQSTTIEQSGTPILFNAGLRLKL